MQKLYKENERLIDIISQQRGKIVLITRIDNQESTKKNGIVVDLTNLEDSINRLWKENLQLKLNLSKPHILLLDKQASELSEDLAHVSQLRQIQRRIRMQKLHAMRIPKHMKAASRNGVLTRKVAVCGIAIGCVVIKHTSVRPKAMRFSSCI